MIIGRGDIGTALKDSKRDDLLFFASGVSNSKCKDESEYQREIDLLLEQNREAHIVYFSSLAVFYSKTRYTQHKLDMEAMIKENFKKYCIVRIGNIDFGTNPHTLINYLKSRIAEGKHFTLENTYRYVISKKELLYWIDLIPDFSCEMNCPGKRLKVKEIAREYCGLRD